MIEKNTIIEKLKGLSSAESTKKASKSKNNVFKVNRARISVVANYIKGLNGRLQGIFGSDRGKEYEINYLFTLDHFKNNFNLVVQTIVSKGATINSIQEYFPIAVGYQQELTNRLGVNFYLPKHPDEIKYLCVPYSIILGIYNGHLFQFGIFDQIHKNNSYFEINEQDTIIREVKLKSGWLYRGIQPLLSQKDPFRKNKLLQRVSGLAAVHHQIAYFSGLEEL